MKKMILAGFLMAVTSVFAQNEYSAIDLRDTLLARSAGVGEKVLEEQKLTKNSGWRVTSRVHGKTPDRDKIIANCTNSFSENGVTISISAGINEFLNARGTPYMVSSGVEKIIIIPKDATGKTLKVDFDFKVSGQTTSFIIFLGNGKNNTIRGLNAVIPPGAEKAVVILRIEGARKLHISKVKVSIVDSSTGEYDVLQFPHGFLDAKFYLPEKDAMPVSFMTKRGEARYPKNVFLCLKLPEGYRLVGTDQIMPVDKVENGVYRLNYSKAISSTITINKFCVWRMYSVFIASDLSPGEKYSPMLYWLEVGGEEGETKTLMLRTVKQEYGKAPRHFLTGYSQPSAMYYDAPLAEDFVTLLKDSGFNLFGSGVSPELREVLKRNNFTILGSLWPVRDGHVKGEGAPFIGIDGEKHRDVMCPIEVYRKGEYFLNNTQKKLSESMATSDHNTTNWEAYSLDYKGCFCENCLKEFSKFAKIPESELRKVWPRDVIEKYHDQWVDFRSWQHGQLCKVIEETVNAAGRAAGKESHFIPMCSVAGFNETSKFNLQYHPKDYLQYLSLVNVWGPYLHSAGHYRLYTYSSGRYLQHYFGVRNVMDYVKKYSYGRDVKVTGLPYGSHGGNVNPPEAVALETIDNFIVGYVGSNIYWMFFDYRYWSKMAEANNMIATYEDMVNKWDKTDKFKTEIVSETIAPRHWSSRIASYAVFPKLKDATSVVQTVGWHNGKKNLLAIGNFWEIGDVFVKLSVPGISGDYVINQPHSKKYMRVKGKELSNGIILHLPPLKWDFFLIEPYDKGQNYGEEFTVQSVEKLFQGKTSFLKKQMEYENKLFDEFQKATSFEDFNFDATPEITTGKVSLKEYKVNGKQALGITAPDYQIIMEPANGGNLKSWKIDGHEIAGDSFGRLGFWKPNRQVVDQQCRIMKISPEKECLDVILELPDFHGMKIIITWSFYEAKVVQSATISNNGKHDLELAPRFHHMLVHLKRHDGRQGSFTIGSEVFDIEPKHRMIEKSENHVTFSSPFIPFKLIYQTSSPLHGYYMWNHPGAEIGTFEPSFKQDDLPLKSGESRAFAQSWSWMK
ncbi:MAG: hypothetical protein WC340_04855 [Kiritimatiellia bacterium]